MHAETVPHGSREGENVDLVLTECREPTVAEQPVEMVERKGLGHPDTLCDALAEEVSIALSRFYLERFGTILHHNVDKVLLVGGRSEPVFGGGEVVEPIEVHLAGRATSRVGTTEIPIETLAIESCRSYLRGRFRHLDPDRHFRFHSRIRPGSADLVELFQRSSQPGTWLANDSSCGAGFAPLSPLERTLLDAEESLLSPAMLDAHPERGQDLKLMGVRSGGRVALTVADAFVSAHVHDLDDYRRKREALREDARAATGADEVEVNHADDLERGAIYLTVTGTSAESGDDGEAGRGNRPSGLITPYRPMTMESVAGKNPVSHLGKLYNVLAFQIAERLVAEVPGLRAADCYLVSRIGEPVTRPQLTHVRCWLAPDHSLDALRPRVREVVGDALASLPHLHEAFLARRLRIA